jgi:PKD repeat protein
MQAVIKVSGEPNGKFLINKAYLFDAGDSTSPDGTINKYEWNFGDGTGTKKSKTVTYGFKQEGVYEVTLKVTDEKGNTATKSQKIIIGNPPRVPKAIIETMPIKGSAKSLTGAAPFEVEFNAQNSTDPDNNITEYRWDFESDGRDDQFGPVVTKVFEKAGTYKVTLTVQDSDDNESKEILFVTVTPPGLSARVTATPNFGTVPLVVSFDASASSYPDGQIIGYEWDFGDKTPKRQDAANPSRVSLINTNFSF